MLHRPVANAIVGPPELDKMVVASGHKQDVAADTTVAVGVHFGTNVSKHINNIYRVANCINLPHPKGRQPLLKMDPDSMVVLEETRSDEEDDLTSHDDSYGSEDKSLARMRKNRRRYPCTVICVLSVCTCLSLLTIICSIVLGVVLPLVLGTVNRGSSTLFYIANDTRIVAYNYIFCEGIALADSSGDLNVTLHAVTRQPETTGERTLIRIEEENTQVQPGNFMEHHLHLHEGSLINVSVHDSSGGSSRLLIIKGSKNFDAWRTGRAYTLYNSADLDMVGVSDQSFSQEIRAGDGNDDYYIVVFNAETASETTEYTATFDYYRTQLDLQYSDYSCTSLWGRRCTIPTNQYRWYILEVGNSINATELEYITSISTECVKRTVTFVLIPVAPVLLFFLLCCFCIPCCAVCKREYSASKEKGLEWVDGINPPGKFKKAKVKKGGRIKYSAHRLHPYQPPLSLQNPTAVGKAYS